MLRPSRGTSGFVLSLLLLGCSTTGPMSTVDSDAELAPPRLADGPPQRGNAPGPYRPRAPTRRRAQASDLLARRSPSFPQRSLPRKPTVTRWSRTSSTWDKATRPYLNSPAAQS